jgi:DNA-binding LacI/PurR family transcriptional regulator
MGHGLAIPRDLSLIGYDNNPISAFMPFKLASVDLNLENVYHQAVSALIKSIKSGDPINQGVMPILVEGDSVQERLDSVPAQ